MVRSRSKAVDFIELIVRTTVYAGGSVGAPIERSNERYRLTAVWVGSRQEENLTCELAGEDEIWDFIVEHIVTHRW